MASVQLQSVNCTSTNPPNSLWLARCLPPLPQAPQPWSRRLPDPPAGVRKGTRCSGVGMKKAASSILVQKEQLATQWSSQRDGPCERSGSSWFATASFHRGCTDRPLPCLDHAAGLLIFVLQWAAKEASGCEGLKGERARGERRAGRETLQSSCWLLDNELGHRPRTLW